MANPIISQLTAMIARQKGIIAAAEKAAKEAKATDAEKAVAVDTARRATLRITEIETQLKALTTTK